MLAQHSKRNSCYGTPAHLVADARKVMGSIDIDPCTDEEQNQGVVKATMFYDEETDGLTHHWDYSALFGELHSDCPTNAFVNPDGRIVKEMWAKALDEFYSHRCKSVFWVGFSLSQLAYLDPNPLSFNYCILRKRLCFTAWRWHMGDDYEWKRTLDIDTNPTHNNYVALMTHDGIARARFGEVFTPQGYTHVEAIGTVRCIRSVSSHVQDSEDTASRVRPLELGTVSFREGWVDGPSWGRENNSGNRSGSGDWRPFDGY